MSQHEKLVRFTYYYFPLHLNSAVSGDVTVTSVTFENNQYGLYVILLSLYPF